MYWLKGGDYTLDQIHGREEVEARVDG